MSPPDPSQPTVLVIDDEPAILNLLRLALTSVGWSVRTTIDGAEAVAIYAEGGIDLVLLDVLMPLPWDGPRTLAALRAIDPDVRAAFMSGSTGSYSYAELHVWGGRRVITKPFSNFAQLDRELRELLSGVS